MAVTKATSPQTNEVDQPLAIPAPRRRPVSGSRPTDLGLARECFERVRELSQSKDERISLAACKEILDRIHGKPEQAHRLDAEGAGVVVVIREGQTSGPDHE